MTFQMSNVLGRALRRVDRLLAPVTARSAEDQHLISFLFHTVCDDPNSHHSRQVDPHQGLTIAGLRKFIDYFLEHEFSFITPRDIPALQPSGRFAMMTFDDGYANNLLALPVLRSYHVPAVIYVSTNHVRYGKAFWWDVVYRNRHRQKRSESDIELERAVLKRKTVPEIEAYLTREFGAGWERPAGDLDRPLTPAELRDLAEEPLIEIGNHTADHAILTLCDSETMRSQIELAQSYLASETGSMPITISYPNGNYDKRVIVAAQACGLIHGITTLPHKNRVPFAEGERMTTGRYCVFFGPDLYLDLAVCRSSAQLYSRLVCSFKGRSM
jgi:peptidoglycan/xylan/chitin deacetylase (PgdA/CDA1 family)